MATSTPLTIAARPSSIDGCMSSWNETFLANTIRSSMEDLYVKTRRRTTGLIRTIDTDVTLKAALYDDFIKWFRVNQRGGTIPTRIKRPQDGKEIVVRASGVPAISWINAKAFKVTMKWEQMPEWETL